MAECDGGKQAGENFSRNIKARREAIGMSQEHFAKAMTARGFGFTQATVWKVESCQRGVSLTEGLAIAEILSNGRQPLGVESLMRAPAVDRARQALELADADLAAASARIEDTVAGYVEATRAYAAAYAIATEQTPEHDRVGAIWQWAEPTAPELIALAARLRHDDGNDDSALDAVAAWGRIFTENSWPWQPWQPGNVNKVVPDDGEHNEAT